MRILEIGCGESKYKSENPEDIVIGLDLANVPGVDVVHNLDIFPYPFEDNEFDMIVSTGVLEHLTDLAKVMEELCRISKDKGIIKASVPYFSYLGAYQDPTHKRFFTVRTFEYFTENSIYPYYSKARVKILERKLRFFSYKKGFGFLDKIINSNQRVYERIFANIFPCELLEVVLEVVKNNEVEL